MNERIFELIQAQNGFRGLLWTEEDKQEFAELIVRECAEICFSIDKEYEGEDVLATWCADGILKHFGVKQ